MRIKLDKKNDLLVLEFVRDTGKFDFDELYEDEDQSFEYNPDPKGPHQASVAVDTDGFVRLITLTGLAALFKEFLPKGTK